MTLPRWDRCALLIAAGIALFGALIHGIAPLLGPDWYAFLTSPPAVVEAARAGQPWAAASALLIGALMAACAAYAFIALGLLQRRRLPLPRLALAVISTLCLLRGLLIFPLLLRVPERLSAFDITASLVWLIAGLGFAIGTARHWRSL